MAARRTSRQEIDPDAPTLKEVLSDSGDSRRVAFNSVDSLAVIRLVHSVSSLGGMVTFWVDSSNDRLCFSMRLWNDRRSYQIEDPSQFRLVSEPIVEKLSKFMAEKKIPPPPPYPAPVKEK